jgi:hypothetical protein
MSTAALASAETTKPRQPQLKKEKITIHRADSAQAQHFQTVQSLRRYHPHLSNPNPYNSPQSSLGMPRGPTFSVDTFLDARKLTDFSVPPMPPRTDPVFICANVRGAGGNGGGMGGHTHESGPRTAGAEGSVKTLWMTNEESAPVRWKWDAFTSATSFGMAIFCCVARQTHNERQSKGGQSKNTGQKVSSGSRHYKMMKHDEHMVCSSFTDNAAQFSHKDVPLE